MTAWRLSVTRYTSATVVDMQNKKLRLFKLNQPTGVLEKSMRIVDTFRANYKHQYFEIIVCTLVLIIGNNEDNWTTIVIYIENGSRVLSII